MPELFSRMDEASWLTPSIADILEQGSNVGSENSIRDIILTLQQDLSQLETPARIVNVRNLTSHTLFVTKPETVGRLGNRRTIRPEEIEASIQKLNDKHQDWLLGYTPTVPNEDADMVGIYLKTASHRPLNLRRVLVRNTFRKYPTTMVVPVGVDLAQQMYLRDLALDGHCLIISRDAKHRYIARTILLTLILLNTPAELRIAIGGTNPDAYKLFIGSPHALGRFLNTADNVQRLLDGLNKETKRRQQLITTNGFDKLDEYNDKLRENQLNILPRVLVALDNVQEYWQDDKWHEALKSLIENGAQVGIHTLLALNPDDEKVIRPMLRLVQRPIIMSSARQDLVQPLEDFHPSLHPFVNAYTIEDKYNAVPIETLSVTSDEIRQAVEYWRNNASQRQKESIQDISGKTGVTDMLTMPPGISPDQRPPVPEVPTVETLQKATQALATVTDEESANSDGLLNKVHENRAPARKTTPPPPPPPKPSADKTEQARALAAYMGWLSASALQDVLACNPDEASKLFEQLQAEGVIEKNQKIARFLRAKD